MPRGKNGMCWKGLHDLSQPGAKYNSGHCKKCFGEYMSTYRKNLTKSRRQLIAILAVLEDQK